MRRGESDAAVAAASVTSNLTDDPTHDIPSVVVVPANPASARPAYAAADTVTIENVDPAPAPTMEEILSNLIVHEDRPIENLPTMTASELKLIGRCVSLCVKQNINGVSTLFYYTGLVSMVTDTTVTLMYVNRYTKLDFKFYKSRESRIADFISLAGFQAEFAKQSSEMGSGTPDNTTDPHSSTNAAPPAAAAAAAASAREGDAAAESPSSPAATQPVELKSTPSLTKEQQQRREMAQYHPDPAGSLCPAVRLSLEPAGGIDPTLVPVTTPDGMIQMQERAGSTLLVDLPRPTNFRLCAESVGTLPYVTFLRTNIHDVSFGRDPSSDFYRLFADPSKELIDMQFLRTFVRRYLVHTSENNNPRQVPMYAFLTVRGGCPQLDRSLADRVMREELPALLRADKAIEKEKRKQLSRARRMNETIEEYRAPPGPFANTGILYLTQVPQQTFMSATITLVFTIGFTLFLFISMASLNDSLITLFIAAKLSYFIPSIMVWAMSGILTLLHSTMMHLPLRDNLEILIARIFFSTATVVCGILCLLALTRDVSNASLERHMYRRRYDSLCSFYVKHQCSGFFTPCEEADPTDSLCNTCYDVSFGYTPCYMDVWGRVQFIILPLLLFTVFILLSGVNALMLLLKLCMIARSVSRAAFW